MVVRGGVGGEDRFRVPLYLQGDIGRRFASGRRSSAGFSGVQRGGSSELPKRGFPSPGTSRRPGGGGGLGLWVDGAGDREVMGSGLVGGDDGSHAQEVQKSSKVNYIPSHYDGYDGLLI